jgi:hypothetical protein
MIGVVGVTRKRSVGRTRRLSLRASSVMALAAVALLAGLVAVSREAQPGPSAGDISAYQDSIHAAIQHWGQIEIYGMQPAIADLRNGRGVGPEAIGGEAAAWGRGLEQVRQQLQGVTPPSGLSHAADLFQEALGKYLQVAKLVEQATAVDGAARLELLDHAALLGRSGDCVYDNASVDLQNARVAAGLGTTADYPDHQCSTPSGG